MTPDEFARLAKVLGHPLLLLSSDGDVVAANPAATRLVEVRPGTPLRDVLADPDGFDERLRTWMRHGGPVPARLDVRVGAEDVPYHADVGRLTVGGRPALLVSLRGDESDDWFARITDRLQALQRETRHRRIAEQHHQARLSAERASREQLERLQSLTSALASALSVEDTVEAILALGPAVLDHDLVVALADDSRALRLRPARADIIGVQADDLHLTDTPQPVQEALAQREVLFFSTAEDLLRNYPQVRVPVPDGGPAYLAGAVPMVAKAGEPPIGVLGCVSNDGRGLSGEQRVAAGIVAAQCAQALDRARLYDTERRFAETLQRALLPLTFPDTSGVECAVRYLPATERRAVGGDWYAVIALGSGRVGLAVGDVAGHGPAAATAMGTMRNALRALATTEDRPAAVLDAFNTFVCEQLHDEMATVAYLVADTHAGTLTYANAGHPPPLLLAPGARPAYLRGALQPPVGAAPDTRHEEMVERLDPRCDVVLYTDGLVERRGEDIDLGFERLRRASDVGEAGPDELCDHLLAALVGTEPLTDDVAILVASIVADHEAPHRAPAEGTSDRGDPDEPTEPPGRPATRTHGSTLPEPPDAHALRHRSARRWDRRPPRPDPARPKDHGGGT